jgi:prepilin-type N-terminal cleavage/methylation domain-containing protein
MLKQKGFTLIELLVVIAIVGLLASVVLVSLNSARQRAKIARSASDQKQLGLALMLYFDDMGFYPPDVNRGWDPGFSHVLPYNPDSGLTDTPACAYCPVDWVAQVQAKWKGPYIIAWPARTAWNGKYDYNYWPAPGVRYGCNVLAGVYIGVQRDYDENNPVPPDAEQKMVEMGLDADGCVNGESQFILQGF